MCTKLQELFIYQQNSNENKIISNVLCNQKIFKSFDEPETFENNLLELEI